MASHSLFVTPPCWHSASPCRGATAESSHPDRAVLLPISEIDAPASILEGETLVVRLTVVFGGCRSFERLETTCAAARVTFKARGLDSSGPDISCTADVRTQVVESRIEPPLTDPVTLVAVQPDESEITRTVRVTTR